MAAQPIQQAAPGPSSEDLRAKDEALLNKANSIRGLWKTLATAFSLPQELPPRNKCHWDFVLQESAWLAHDFMQERLWRQATAYQLAHGAAQFNRKHLRPTKTVVCQSVEKADNEFGRVAGGGKGDSLPGRGSAKQTSGHAEANGPGYGDGSPVQLLTPPCFIAGAELVPLVMSQLEDEDVARLARHADAQAKYQAMFEEARRAHPSILSIDDDDLLFGRRKARKQKPLAAEDGDADLAGSPQAPRGAGAGRPRPGAGGQQSGAGRAMGDQDDGGPRDRRKRKNREYGDEDYEANIQGSNKAMARDRMGSMRPPPGPGAMRQDGRPDLAMPGGAPGLDRKGTMARNNSGLKSPPGKGVVQRQDSMARMGSMPGQRGMFGVGGPRNLWTHLDDQVLVAFVTEFGQNWFLVADVLRTASAIAGISRRADACKQRYILLQRAQLQIPDGEEMRPEQLATPLLNKQAAKEILGATLPVSEQVLAAHRNVLADVVSKLQQKRAAERAQSREMHKYRAVEHASHTSIQQKMLSMTGGRVLNPLEIGVVAEVGVPAAAPAAQGGAGSGAAPARAASQQDGGGGAGGGGGSVSGSGSGGLKLPPGMSKEQLMAAAQGNSLQQLQQNVRMAQAAAQASPTPQTQQALQTAQAILQAHQSMANVRQQQALQQQQQQLQQQQLLQQKQQQQLAAGAGTLGTAGVAGGGMGQQGPGIAGTPAVPASRTQSGGPGRLVTLQEMQGLIQSKRIPPPLQQMLLNAATNAQLTTTQLQQVVKNHQQQQQLQLQQQQQQRSQSMTQLQQMGGQQQAAWPNQAAHAAAAAAAANQAASQAAAAALAGAGGMPGMPYGVGPQQLLNLPVRPPSQPQ